MAGDTLAINDEVSTPCLKVYRSRGCLVGWAGDYYAGHIFLEWFERKARRKKRPSLGDLGEFSALVLDPDGDIFTCDSHCVLVREPLPFFAVGSGAAYALSAMELGLSAEEAVVHASKFDPYTGGKVTIERL